MYGRCSVRSGWYWMVFVGVRCCHCYSWNGIYFWFGQQAQRKDGRGKTCFHSYFSFALSNFYFSAVTEFPVSSSASRTELAVAFIVRKVFCIFCSISFFFFFLFSLISFVSLCVWHCHHRVALPTLPMAMAIGLPSRYTRICHLGLCSFDNVLI